MKCHNKNVILKLSLHSLAVVWYFYTKPLRSSIHPSVHPSMVPLSIFPNVHQAISQFQDILQHNIIAEVMACMYKDHNIIAEVMARMYNDHNIIAEVMACMYNDHNIIAAVMARMYNDHNIRYLVFYNTSPPRMFLSLDLL